MNTHKAFLIAGLAVSLAACAQPSPRTGQITVDPILTKYDSDRDGGGGCPSGQTAGASGPCVPPTGQGYQRPTGPQGPGAGGQSPGGTAQGGQAAGGRP